MALPRLHKRRTKAHPGFKAEERKLERKGYSKAKADDILGAMYWKMKKHK